MAKKYKLELTEEQTNIVCKALELYSRLKMGQWQELVDLCLDLNDPDYAEKKFDKLIPALMQARQVAYSDLSLNYGHSYGVGKFEDADLAFEIYEVIRHRMAWDRQPDGGCGVDFDKPHSFRGNELAVCTNLENEENDEISAR